MNEYKVMIELEEGGYDAEHFFTEVDDEEANGKCYGLADKGYYKLYRKVANGGLVGFHWKRVKM